MSQTKKLVVHCQREKYDVYIGRGRGIQNHYGNPFTHLEKETLAAVKVATREDSIQSFREWLKGTDYTWVDPVRRLWILDTLKSLQGKILGCWCKPQSCHGDVLVEMIDELNRTELRDPESTVAS